MKDQPDVLVDTRRLIISPREPAAEERQKQEYAIDKLDTRARHVALVEEPVKVQERRRQLIEDKRYAVVICKWMLGLWSITRPRKEE